METQAVVDKVIEEMTAFAVKNSFTLQVHILAQSPNPYDKTVGLYQWAVNIIAETQEIEREQARAVAGSLTEKELERLISVASELCGVDANA